MRYKSESNRRPLVHNGRIKVPIIIAYLSLLVFCKFAIANDQSAIREPADVASSWTLAFENDIFVGEDSGYTNGLGVVFARGLFDQFSDENTPRFLLKLIGKSYINSGANRRRGIIYAFAQTMQTPEDILESELQVGDVPYAGLLVAEAQFYSVSDRISDKLSLTVGVVGPASFAEQSQVLVHRAIGSDIPQGWDNQVNNELVGKIELQRGFRAFYTDIDKSIELDLIAVGNGAIGNLTSFASTSVIARAGTNLENSFPVISLLPNRQVNTLVFENRFSWYFFTGVQTAYVLNDIFANGNTFSDSHSVDLDHTQTRVSGGLSFGVNNWAVTLVYSKFNGVPNEDPFGSFSISHRF